MKIGLTAIDDTINGFLKPVNKQVKVEKIVIFYTENLTRKADNFSWVKWVKKNYANQLFESTIWDVNNIKARVFLPHVEKKTQWLT